MGSETHPTEIIGRARVEKAFYFDWINDEYFAGRYRTYIASCTSSIDKSLSICIITDHALPIVRRLSIYVIINYTLQLYANLPNRTFLFRNSNKLNPIYT